MNTNELKQNQKLILEKLDTLTDDRDKVATKEDIGKIQKDIIEIKSQLKNMDKTVFREENSVRNRVVRLENGYESIKKDNTIIKRSALFILIGVVGFWIKDFFKPKIVKVAT